MLKPIIKWAGGKGQNVNVLMQAVPAKFNRYYEPFLGGGALLLALYPKRAVINDANMELMNLYKVIKSAPDDLIKLLLTYPDDKTFYYNLRAELPSFIDPVKAAARTLYLNKCGFNGLYRVNRTGRFNVPYGKRATEWKPNQKSIIELSKYLNSNQIDILACDFEEAVADSMAGDFIYFDPPYDTLTDTANFTQYTPGGFGHAEQERLMLLAHELTERGVRVMITNAYTQYIRDLYKDPVFNITAITAKRNINSDADKRGPVMELIITNYQEDAKDETPDQLCQ
jgi:DNA adenine methylase